MKQREEKSEKLTDVDLLQVATRKKYSFSDKEILTDDDVIKILGNFNSNIGKFHEYFRQEPDRNYVKHKYEQHSSFYTFFQHFPYESNQLEKEIEKLRIQNTSTIQSFVRGESKKPRVPTRDFFSVCLGYSSFKSFSDNYPNIDPIIKKYSEKEILPPSLPETETQQFQIAGATIIDDNFIQNIKKLEFSMAEFYTAKQHEHCQWYGIIQGWDIKRNAYTKLKPILENSFEKERKNKVSSIVHGYGGGGKSTLLRRVALDLSSSSDFKVLWIDDFEEFLNGNQQYNKYSGWDKVKDDFSCNYIVFIEDLYREIGSNSKENYANINAFKDFLKITQSVRNIRLVIGDRYMHVEMAGEYLYNDDHRFLLHSNENKYIINQIALKIPQWQVIIKKDFNNKLQNIPLFMLLFIIAKVGENEEYLNLDLSEPHKAFQDIIRSDLKQLARCKCSGLAQTLYYWSCIYSEYRIFISYETLLQLAKKFNSEEDDPPREYKNLQLNSPVTRILNTYIGTRIHNQKYNIQIFFFNHDILSDKGLSKVPLDNWEGYNDITLKRILKTIIKNGDGASASIFLNRISRLKPSLFEGKQDKLKYINKLIDRGVQHYSYTSLLVDDIFLTSEELDDFANRLWGIEFYSVWFWTFVLKNKELNSKWSKNIMDSFMISKSPQVLASSVLHYYRGKNNDELLQKVCNKILCENISKIDTSFAVYSALKLSNDKGEDGIVQETCKKILEKVIEEGLSSSHPNIIAISLGRYRGKHEHGLVQQVCQIIIEKIKKDDISSLPYQIICIALTKLPNKEDVLLQQVYHIILKKIKDDGTLSLHTTLISIALQNYRNDNGSDLIQKVCCIIIEKIKKDDISSFSHKTICFLIKQSENNEDLLQLIYQKILEKIEDDGILSLHTNLISIALQNYRNHNGGDLIQKVCCIIIEKTKKDALLQQVYHIILKKIKDDGTLSLHTTLISIALQNYRNDNGSDLIQKVCCIIIEKIKKDDISSLPYQIICTALTKLATKEDVLLQQVYHIILKKIKDDGTLSLHTTLISIALQNYRNDNGSDLIQKVCCIIIEKIKKDDILSFSRKTIYFLIKQSENNEDLLQLIYQKILEKIEDDGILSFHTDLITIALKWSKYRKDLNLVQRVYQRILKQIIEDNNILILYPDLVAIALKNYGDTEETALVQQTCEIILEYVLKQGIRALPYDCVSSAFYLCKDIHLKQKIANLLLWKTKKKK